MNPFTLHVSGVSTAMEIFERYTDMIALQVNYTWFRSTRTHAVYSHQWTEINPHTWLTQIILIDSEGEDDLVPCFATVLINANASKDAYEFIPLHIMCFGRAGAQQICIMESEAQNQFTAYKVIPSFDSRLYYLKGGRGAFGVRIKIFVLYRFEDKKPAMICDMSVHKCMLEYRPGYLNWSPVDLKSLTHTK